MLNFYDRLDITTNSTSDEIRRAYRKCAFKYHPDKNPTNREESTEIFKQVSEAYAILSDEVSRRQYDAELKEERKVQQQKQRHKDKFEECFSNSDAEMSYADADTAQSLSPSTSSTPTSSGRQSSFKHDFVSHHGGTFTTNMAFDIFDMLFGNDSEFGEQGESRHSEGRKGRQERGSGKFPKVSKSSRGKSENSEDGSVGQLLGMMMACADVNSTVGRVHRGHSSPEEGYKVSNGVVHVIVQSDGSLATMELLTPGRSEHWHRHRSIHAQGCSEDVTMASQREKSYRIFNDQKNKSPLNAKNSSSTSPWSPSGKDHQSNDKQMKTKWPAVFTKFKGKAQGRSNSVAKDKTKICLNSPRPPKIEYSLSSSVINSKGEAVPIHVDRYSKQKRNQRKILMKSNSLPESSEKIMRSKSSTDADRSRSDARKANIKHRTPTPARQRENSVKSLITSSILKRCSIKVKPIF
mmetsp:Transcript_11094/g.18139  ORF Transcript_11094/g.18139 Transcript_11094/m.18139 type:complete len:465 (+) Transcript_11094:104-1498(+)